MRRTLVRHNFTEQINTYQPLSNTSDFIPYLYAMSLFINIHSHTPARSNEWVIQSLYQDFEKAALPGSYSIGLHPWYIQASTWRQAFIALQQYSRQQQVFAIGECGLDKVCETDFALQEEVFVSQLLWANEINKPLVIHCVRAFEEVMYSLKKNQNKVPVIFHGFNKNRILAEKLIEKGYWLSFGKDLLHENMQEVFAALPLDKIFLETDDATAGIGSIYQSAASIKNISTEQLILQINKNTLTVFNTVI